MFNDEDIVLNNSTTSQLGNNTFEWGGRWRKEEGQWTETSLELRIKVLMTEKETYKKTSETHMYSAIFNSLNPFVYGWKYLNNVYAFSPSRRMLCIVAINKVIYPFIKIGVNVIYLNTNTTLIILDVLCQYFSVFIPGLRCWVSDCLLSMILVDSR